MCSYQSISLDNPELTSPGAPSSVAWKEVLYKASLTAVIAGTAAAFLIPSGSVSIAGMSVPQSAAIGLGAAGGSIAGDLAHNYILPHIPQNEKYLAAESAAVSIGAAMGGAYLAMSMMGDIPITTPLLLGGGSYVAADYAYRNFLDMKTGGFIY